MRGDDGSVSPSGLVLELHQPEPPFPMVERCWLMRIVFPGGYCLVPESQGWPPTSPRDSRILLMTAECCSLCDAADRPNGSSSFWSSRNQ